MIHAIAAWLFSHTCHQELARTWVPGGVPLALCQRCTGVYAGAALMLFLLPWMRFPLSRRMAAVHAAFILQMVILGGQLAPHPAAIRTLSGQLFIAGVFYFVWGNLSARMGLMRDNFSVLGYAIGFVVALSALQALVHAHGTWAAPLLDLLALIGVCAILLAAVATLGDIALRIAHRQAVG